MQTICTSYYRKNGGEMSSKVPHNYCYPKNVLQSRTMNEYKGFLFDVARRYNRGNRLWKLLN